MSFDDLFRRDRPDRILVWPALDDITGIALDDRSCMTTSSGPRGLE
jgi:hypothetical protein